MSLKNITLCTAGLLISLISCQSPQKKDQKPKFKNVGNIEILDEDLNQVINTESKIEVLASGFLWSEGPLWLSSINKLIFSDVPKNTVYSWSTEDSIEIYLNPSGYTGELEYREGSNGLILNNDGKLVLCQHGNRQLAEMKNDLNNPKEDYSALADTHDGNKFNSPNDAVQSKKGTYFFTDPPYGLTEEDTQELPYFGVYKLSNGEVTLLIDSLTRPNGIALSPDESILYVAQSDPNAARYYAYELNNDEEIISGKVLLDVTPLIGEENKGLPDGIKTDDKGNLFATGPGGVLIITPEGRHLGTIRTENATANCAFNGDKSILYMTAHSHLMRIAIK